MGVLKNKERHWFWAMARCCWAHLVLQVRSFGPQRNFGSGGLLPARHAGGLQGCAISAYKLLPFRPPSISFPSRSSLQARPGDDGPPCSCRDLLHIISYHFVLWDASSCLIRRPRGKHRADSVPQPTGPFRPPPPSMGAPPRTAKRTSRPGLSFTARPHGGVQVHSGRLDGCSTVLL